MMSAFRQAAEEYLAIRRSLGYALRQEGRMLSSFVSYLEARGIVHLAVKDALDWATEPVHASPAWWARRLGVVRGFASYLKTIEEATEVPPRGVLPSRASRTAPYLFTDAQIAALMAGARGLACPLRAATFETLIGLLAVTGLRTGEAMALNRADVNLTEGVLTVWRSKLSKSREVLLHESTCVALASYAARREELCPHPKTESFLLSGAGTRLNHTNASTTFAGLLKAAGVSTPPGRRRPSLYALRHSFAVQTLIAWHAEDADVQSRLPVLSTWMGHVKPSSTYWYLEAAPELLGLAAARLERHIGGRS
jgi:integrase/recombinase XerD